MLQWIMHEAREINEHLEKQTHILYVFVIELVVQSFFDGLLLFGDFIKSWDLHPSDHHLQRREINTQNLTSKSE